MDALLAFFADFILFTAGIAVVILWIVVIFAVAIEAYDGITGKNKEEEEL